MINREENQQNLNISFKLKLIKKEDDLPGWGKTQFKLNIGPGLYEQLNNANKVAYNPGSFSLKMIEEAVGDFFNKKKKDEYRKKFDFRSKIFKQTYKFG